MNFYLPLTGTIDIRDTDVLYEETQSSLRLIVGGSKKKRLLDLNKGVGLERFLFQNDIDLNIIENEIRSQVNAYVSHIQILEIAVIKEPNDYSASRIQIKWTIPSVNGSLVKTTYFDLNN